MLPDIPLELWHRILAYTCSCYDNRSDAAPCTTPLVLSRTCHELRRVSRYHRYHSVTIRGWEQLLAFEKQLNAIQVDGSAATQPDGAVRDGRGGDREAGGRGHSGIVHLKVEIENLWDVVYTEEEEDDSKSETNDSDGSYVPGSESLEPGGLGESDGGAYDGSDTERSDESDAQADKINDDVDGEHTEEEALEYAEISELELAEVEEEKAGLHQDREMDVPSAFETEAGAQNLSFLLLGRPTPLARFEYRLTLARSPRRGSSIFRYAITLKEKEVYVTVGANWEGKIGRLDSSEMGQLGLFAWNGYTSSSTFYVVQENGN